MPPSITPRQQKRLERLAKSLKDRDIAAIEHLSDIEEKVEDVAAFVASEISGVKEELKKKLDTVYEIDPEEIRGPKGDDGADGEPGLDADEEEIIDRLTPVLLSKIPTPQEVAAYVPNLKGDPGVAPTVEEIVAAIPKPKDGRDGSPDTPLEAARKLNTLRDAIEPTVIKGLDEIGRLARIGAANVAAPSASHTALQQVANRVAALESNPVSASPLTTKGDLYGYDTADARIAVGTDGYVLTADSSAATGVSWQAAASVGSLTYMFANAASDISTYRQAVSLNSYTVGALGDITTAGVSTSATLLGTFATNLGFPNVTLIPVGSITVHYDAEKVAGSNNYYTFARIYKRTSGGAETLIATTDDSSQTAVNTRISTTVVAANLANISMSSTDRIVVKVYGVMVSSTATIHLYYDDATSARVELPSATVDATNFVPYSGDTAVKTWTYAATLLKTALGTTTADGWVLSNTTAAAAGAQQVSPAERFASYGWNSGGAGSSQLVEFRRFSLPVQGASGATGLLKTQMQRNGGGWSDILTQSTTGEIVQTVLSSVNATTGLKISHPFSNSTPGTTRALLLESSGGYNGIEFSYSNVLRQALIGVNDGQMSYYASGGSYHAFYSGNSGLSSTSLFAYLYPTAFVHTSGYGAFANGVHAGNQGAPTSTLQSAGGTALKVKRITAGQALDDTATVWLCDASTSAACTGTPSTSTCSSYTGSGQATCESHLPCVWNAGSPCSDFNNEAGMGTCAGTSGCSVDTSACSSATDQSTCEALDDSYGGSCSWGNTGDCSVLGAGTCGATTGCTETPDDCANYSDGGGDGTACNNANGGGYCSYDSGSGACSGGTFGFLSCSGTYDACSGTYNNGGCSGTYGTACTGTVLCSSYGSSGPCGGEAGCAWTTVMANTLPDIATCPDRLYRLKNVTSSGADVVFTPYAGQTVEFASSLTLSNYLDSVDIQPYRHTASCNEFLTAGACTPSGCTVNNQFCSYDTGSNLCTGNAVCPAHDGNQANCEAQSYFSSCDGTYVVSSNWYVL